MAKKLEVLSSLVSINDVFWRSKFNFGRHIAIVDSPEEERAKAVMLKDGWDYNQPIECSEFDEVGLTDARCIIDEELARLEMSTESADYNGTVLTAKQRVVAFKAMWFPAGVYHAPKYDGTFAFQRGKALPDVIALAIASGKTEADSVKGYKLPVRIVDYSNPSERVKACVLENTRKDIGRKSIMKHWPSLFKAAYDFFMASGCTASMADIKQLLDGGIVVGTANNDAIKVHSLLVLDARFPNVEIKGRILDAGTNENGADLGQQFAQPIDRTHVWKLVQWLDEKKAQLDASDGKIPYATGEVTNENIVKEYVSDPNANKDVRVAPMSKLQVSNRQKISPNLIEQFIWMVWSDATKMEQLTKLTEDKELLKECNTMAEKMGLVAKK